MRLTYKASADYSTWSHRGKPVLSVRSLFSEVPDIDCLTGHVSVSSSSIRSCRNVDTAAEA